MKQHSLETEKTTNQPTERLSIPSSNFLIEGLRNITNFLLTNVDVTFTGIENLQGIHSPIIFTVAPHNGHMDSLFARRAIGRADRKIKNKAIFLAAGDYWNKQPKKALGSLAVRTFPISRDGGEETQRQKGQVEKIIRQGNHLVLFPEGTRSRDPHKKIEERKFKTGAAQWAIATRDLNTVIVPIYMQGTEQIMPAGSSLPRFRGKQDKQKFSVTIAIGKPLNIAQQVPTNFENLHHKEQYTIIKQVTAQIKAFMQAQEEFSLRGTTAVEPY